MRAFALATLLCLLLIRHSAGDACSAVTGNIKAFAQKVLAKLTLPKFFTISDSVVCQIANDTATWAGQGVPMATMTKNLMANSGNYESTVIATKMSMANYLMTFISCASNCGETSWTDYLEGTVLFSMEKYMTKPYNTCVTAEVPKYQAAGKSVPACADLVSKCGIACVTPKLIKDIVKLTIQRSCACTWTSCVKPLIADGVLNITNFLPANGASLLMPKCPSKSD